MPNTRVPVNNTYQTQQVPLIKELNSRSINTNKDDDFVNCFPELVMNRLTKDDHFHLIKRSGSTQFIASTDSGGVRGMYYWKDQSEIYVSILNKMYVYNADTGALITTLAAIFGTTTGKVGFTEFLYDTGVTKLVVTDGTTLSTIDTAHTVVPNVDADMPVHVPEPLFLDGYIFVLKVNTADVYNSDLNDPLAWTAGNFITAEMFADRASHIAKINNYMLIFGAKSIEYFWDAGITPGSPMQRNDTPVKLNGIYGGMAQFGNRIYFVGNQSESEPDVFMLEDFKITNVGNGAIRRHLASLTGTWATELQAGVISIDGHNFYVLDTGTATYALILDVGNAPYMMSMDVNLWFRLIYQNGTRFNISNVLNIGTAGNYKSIFTLDTGQAIYKFDPSLYQDNGTNFTASVVTEHLDFDTYNQKTMSQLIVWADRPPGTAPILVQWTDDDYQTYNTGLSVDLNQEYAQIQRLGRFRRRAFKLTYTNNQPMRLKLLEVDVNIGST